MNLKRFAAGLALIQTTALCFQIATRPNDPSGMSLWFGRMDVRPKPATAHVTLPEIPQRDPWLLYEVGRALFEREWSASEGFLQFPAGHRTTGAANSCSMCHNLPFRSAGTGGNLSDGFGHGRKARHLFGIGLMETIGIQIRTALMAELDTNRNGLLDVPAETRGKRAIVQAAPGVTVDFGSFDDLDGDGSPDLNPAIQLLWVQSDGRGAASAQDAAGLDLVVAFLSSSAGDHQFSTLRAFSIGVLQSVLGLTVQDDVISPRHLREGALWAGRSMTGARQLFFPLPAAEQDGCAAVTTSDVDALEWYLLNHPAPARPAESRTVARAERLLDTYGCTECHVRDWHIRPADAGAGLPGERRFFNLNVVHDPGTGRLRGGLLPLTEASGAKGREHVVRGIFTDLRHHDLGDRFYEYYVSPGGVQVTRYFRTPPLWGVGSTAPYGHDGRSATLDEVVRRHGGEAQKSRDAYVRARASDRRAVLDYLHSLVLFQSDMLSADLNGDGRVDAEYFVGGVSMGPEVFRPALLFHQPPTFRGWMEPETGDRFFSYEITNLEVMQKSITSWLGVPGDTNGLRNCKPIVPGSPEQIDGIGHRNYRLHKYGKGITK